MPTEAISREMRTTEAIVGALVEGGVEYVLGMPGGNTGVVFGALRDHPTIRVVQVREESIGSAMAEAYGRLTGRPVVVMGQGEWIVGNAGQGFLEALLGSSPVLILTEMSENAALSHHGPYQCGSGDYGAWDAKKALEGVTKRVMVSYTPAQAVQHTQLALKHCLTGEPGPAAVVFHGNAVIGRVGPESVPRLYSTEAYLPKLSQAVDPESVVEAATRLRDAGRPVIVAGNGIRVGQATESLVRLAEAVGAPVVTTAGGKGVIPETHPLALGVIGVYGPPAANAALGDADLVLAVGTKLGPVDTADENPALIDPTRQTLIQIDIEPLNASWTYPMDQVVIGDAGLVMNHVREALPATIDSAAGTARVGEIRNSFPDGFKEEFDSDEVPFTPQRVVRALHEAVPDDAIITCDAGENRLFMMRFYQSKCPGGYLQPAAGGGMGYAVPAAMGAKLAWPDRPCIAVCGDGGFSMTLHALMTAIQEDLPIGVVILNNGVLGWVLHGLGKRAVAADGGDFAYSEIAKAIGCDGVRPQSTPELESALEQAVKSTVPFIVDVPTSLNTSFSDLIQSFG